jgi:NADPH:quinone reductase-like Zn-dependent oxidoreductase
VFDTVGGETFQRAFQTLKKGGFMVTVVAFPDGEAERYDVGVTRSFTLPSAQNLTAIKDLVEAGKVKPKIEAILPFAEIKQALALSEGGRARGKIILSMD